MTARAWACRLSVLAVVAALAGCGPYHRQIDNPVLESPAPFPTDADRRALAPYANSPYFPDRP